MTSLLFTILFFSSAIADQGVLKPSTRQFFLVEMKCGTADQKTRVGVLDSVNVADYSIYGVDYSGDVVDKYRTLGMFQDHYINDDNWSLTGVDGKVYMSAHLNSFSWFDRRMDIYRYVHSYNVVSSSRVATLEVVTKEEAKHYYEFKLYDSSKQVGVVTKTEYACGSAMTGIFDMDMKPIARGIRNRFADGTWIVEMLNSDKQYSKSWDYNSLYDPEVTAMVIAITTQKCDFHPKRIPSRIKNDYR